MLKPYVKHIPIQKQTGDNPEKVSLSIGVSDALFCGVV